MASIATAFAYAPITLHPASVKTVVPVKTPALRDMRNRNLPAIMRRIVGNRQLSRQQVEQLRTKLIRSGHLSKPGEKTILPLRTKGPALRNLVRVHDHVLQSGMLTPSAATSVIPGVDFPGMGMSNNPPDTINCVPPDTNAAVGANDVVEIVNLCAGTGSGVGYLSYCRKWCMDA
jgi:hypothetical protein